jgi:hypothetical protein
MSVVAPLPQTGTVVSDATRLGRTLRVSWHENRELMVVSIWERGICKATFHLAPNEVPGLTAALLEGPLAL